VLASIPLVLLLGVVMPGAPAFPQDTIQESEPNDTPATADTAFLGAVVAGRAPGLSNPDDGGDFWIVQAQAGDTIYAALEGCEYCGDGRFWLQLFAADGVTELVVNRSTNGHDPQFSYLAPKTGPYFVRVLYGADDASAPRYTLMFSERKCPRDDAEPNNTRQLAHGITLPVLIHAMWCPGGDVDFYRIDLAAGAILEYSISDWTVGPPEIHVLGPAGESLDSLVTNEMGPAHFTVPRSGNYYLQISSSFGSIHSPYRLSVRTTGQIPPGPGDPPIARSREPVSLLPLGVDPDGDFWIGMTRLSLDGSITRFASPDPSGVHQTAVDPWGNLLVLNPYHLYRFAPPDRTELMIQLGPTVALTMAPTSDGIWILSSWSGSAVSLRKYAWTGELIESHQIADLHALAMPPLLAVDASGAPYIAAGNAVYRLKGTSEPTLFLTHDQPSGISGLAFDIQGNVYVTDLAETWAPYWTNGRPRVVLHDSTGAVVADSFAWWPGSPTFPVFGRNPDGTTNSRLFILDRYMTTVDGTEGYRGRLLELNPAGVRARGIPLQPLVTCPLEPDEAEPNNGVETAHPVTVGKTVTGVSCLTGDQDFFRFSASRTEQLTLEVEGADYPTVALYAADGTTLLASREGAPAVQVTHAVQAGSTYVVRVGSWFGGPKSYTLRLGPSASRPEGLTVALAARELVRPNEILNAAQRVYLDRVGNNDGRYDIGDFRAFLKAESAAGSAQ